jgi:Domain of unknown function (DUF4249)
MRVNRIQYFAAFLILLFATMCKKSYAPPALNKKIRILSIDGVINTGPSAVSSFLISRSVNISDTQPYIPELNAQVQIICTNGNIYPLADTGTNGEYVSNPLTLDPNQKYQLSVSTGDGKKYMSDFVESKTSPPIDSVYWQLYDDQVLGTQVISVYADAHDETNGTRYYRWDYQETWQDQARYEAKWKVIGDSIYPVAQKDELFNCWKYGVSTDILLGSTANLSADIISRGYIAKFVKDDPRFDVEYSMLVRQYALNAESYKYWLTIEQNSQNPGSFFDLQPNQLAGNIHNVLDPGDPVVGYVSASTIQEKRIFIRNSVLPGWKSNFAGNCPLDSFPTNPLNTLKYGYADTSFTIYEFLHGSILPVFPGTIILTKKPCVDCRFDGGSSSKPSYWQN